MKIFAKKKSLKRKRKKRRRRKIKQKRNFQRKMISMQKKPVQNLWSPITKKKKILNDCRNLRKSQFLTYSASRKWWDGLKISLSKNIWKRVKLSRDKKSKNFWCKRKLRFMKTAVERIKIVDQSGKIFQRKIKVFRNEITITKMNWSFTNSLRIFKLRIRTGKNVLLRKKHFKRYFIRENLSKQMKSSKSTDRELKQVFQPVSRKSKVHQPTGLQTYQTLRPSNPRTKRKRNEWLSLQESNKNPYLNFPIAKNPLSS